MNDNGKATTPSAEQTGSPERLGPDPTRIRYLTPDMCTIHLGTHNALHVTVKDERIYGGIYAAYAFPVAHANQYISLVHPTGDHAVEVGIIRDLTEFPPEQVDLVRKALSRRYFIHTVTRINRMGWKYGMVTFDVQTDKGQANFMLRYRIDRVIDYGQRGKVLIDIDENRYLIPDLEALTDKERDDFTRVIYW